MRGRQDVLLVDGYNMIGAWPELERLKETALEEAREQLLHILADYQGFSGLKIVVVFDAHHVQGGRGGLYKQHKLEVVYTKEKETADECIERLVAFHTRRGRHIYVATSDLVEQHVAFGKGALRISARELRLEIEQNRKLIEKVVKPDHVAQRNTVDAKLSLDVKRKLEQMRRGKK